MLDIQWQANTVLIIDRIVVFEVEESDLGCITFLIATRQSRDAGSGAYQICFGGVYYVCMVRNAVLFCIVLKTTSVYLIH